MNVAFQILSEVDTILFSLLILHGLTDSQGCVWRRHLSQLYTIEVTLEKEVSPTKLSQHILMLAEYTELGDESSSKNH
jgi:hypothetical protein